MLPTWPLIELSNSPGGSLGAPPMTYWAALFFPSFLLSLATLVPRWMVFARSVDLVTWQYRLSFLFMSSGEQVIAWADGLTDLLPDSLVCCMLGCRRYPQVQCSISSPLLFFISAVSVQVSQASKKTEMPSNSLIFDARLMFMSLRIGFSFAMAVVVFAIPGKTCT